MSNLSFATQRAVFEQLSTTSSVTSLLGDPLRLYDHVPAGAEFPYAVFGVTHIEPVDIIGENGFDQMISLDVYSRYRGCYEIKTIFHAIHSALDRQSLTLSEGTFLSCGFHEADLGLDQDGLTYRAHMRFRIYVREV